MNEAVKILRSKGYTVDDFLSVINRKKTWWDTHKHKEAKDNAFLMLSVNGLKSKL